MNERWVSAEDEQVVAALATVNPNEVVATYHNFFSPYLETEDTTRATAAIQHQLGICEDKLAQAKADGRDSQVRVFEQRILLHRGMYHLTDTYGPSTALGIAVTLEEQRTSH